MTATGKTALAIALVTGLCGVLGPVVLRLLPEDRSADIARLEAEVRLLRCEVAWLLAHEVGAPVGPLPRPMEGQ